MTRKLLIMATNNEHKLKEVRQILDYKDILIKGLEEVGCYDDIPETADTLEGNALLKARYMYSHYGVDCFADDTGLEVDVLGGEPGVFSARYAGEECDSEANMKKLLNELEKKSDRSAQFRTVIALIIEGKEFLFEGIVKGTIAKEKAGDGGFGYDPIFIPDGFTQTFSQMGNDSKNHISHRALAVEKLFNYLNSI